MAYTVAQLEAIQAAIASGELTVSYEGKTVTYRSMDDLLKAEARIRAALEAAGTLTPAAPSSSFAAYSRD